MKQKATKLDADALKLSRKRRAATRIEVFFDKETAPEYDVISHCRRIYVMKLMKLLLVLPATNAMSERTFSLLKPWKYSTNRNNM